MRVSLVGADCEENLGLGMIAASLLDAGDRVRVIPYDSWDDLDAVVDRVMASRPQVVGLAIQFQHGAPGFLSMAARLRQAGFRGHITCGGQYPTMTWREILEHEPAISSVVLHEGEATVVELVRALAKGHDLAPVPGLALRGADGQPMRTAPRPLSADLDKLPFAHRYRPATRHLGIPFLPISGSRGCWGSCAFCAISTYYSEARAHGVSGRKLRLRSPENIADEMAQLWRAEQGPCLFCFHDDTLLLPRPADSLTRLIALRRALDERGVGSVGLVGKCRPDCVTPELAKSLHDLGVVRMFVGIENGSQRGLDHLQRRTEVADLELALRAFREADIFVCYNLLLFEPKCVLDDIRENIAFMRRHAEIPVNFCRAEPYNGTALHRQIKAAGTLIGNYLGCDYRIGDDRAELAFRIAAAAFNDRNYGIAGVANRTMGLGYMAQILRRFYDVTSTRASDLLERADALVCAISNDTADLLECAVEIAERADLGNHDRITRAAVTLGMRVAAQDHIWHNQLDDLIKEMQSYAASRQRSASSVGLPDKARAALSRLAFATCVVTTAQACGGSADSDGEDSSGGTSSTTTVTSNGGGMSPAGGRGTMIAGDGGAPPAGGRQSTTTILGDGGSPPRGGSASTVTIMGDGGASPTGGRPPTGGWVSDPGGTPVIGGSLARGGSFPRGGATLMGDGGAPPRGGRSPTGGYTVADMGGMPVIGGSSARGGSVARGGTLSGDGGAPPTAGRAPLAGQAGMAPSQAGSTNGSHALLQSDSTCGEPHDYLNPVDPPPPPVSAGALARARNGVSEHWHDSGPQRLTRSEDLPLSDPPEIKLESRVEGGKVKVTLTSADANLSLRWQSDGKVVGKGREVVWHPSSRDDALRVAARGQHGVVFALLRAREVG